MGFFYLYRFNSTNIPTLDKGHKKAKSKAGSPHMFESPREAEGGKAWEIGENGESGESDGDNSLHKFVLTECGME